jgi:gliding motility-associated protein GldM
MRVGGGEYSFNKVMELAYGPEVVNQNEEFEVQVLMAAFDTDKQPEVTYNGNKITNVRDGKGYVKVKAGSSNMTLSGTVAIRKKNGDLTTREWTKEIVVMKPSGSIELPEMNMLYRGYPNKVNATASGYPTTNLSASGASVSKSGEGWIVKPSGRGKTATLSVSGKTADGKSVTLKSMPFRCSNLPDPELYWGGVKNGGKASKSQTKLFAKYPPEIPLNASFSIVKWECQVPGAQGKPPGGPGSNISAASNLLRAAKPGSQVSFICTVVGPDGIQRKKAGAFKI